ncbi:unnamed protein product [Rhodiola kirilowii]
MHVEKDICDILIGILWNVLGKTKDGIKVRLNMVDMNIRHNLLPKHKDNEQIFLHLAPLFLDPRKRAFVVV